MRRYRAQNNVAVMILFFSPIVDMVTWAQFQGPCFIQSLYLTEITFLFAVIQFLATKTLCQYQFQIRYAFW